jgi:chlorophyll/bacteriochlorophyll a synthase
MDGLTTSLPKPAVPTPRAVVALLKPITWFPPMWAFMCGVVSSGAAVADRWPFLFAGILLTGPLVCGTSQAVNDWFDRDVDAINEPDRPIPSGRVPGRWGLWIAIAGTILSLVVAGATGAWVLMASSLGLMCAWAYSAPPLRLKADGWWGPGLVALTYEGLTWFTGATVMLGALPPVAVLITLALYSLGAHGIMTLNDFKAVAGDTATGVRSLPVVLGVRRAARIACVIMVVPQIVVVGWLSIWGHAASAIAVAVMTLGQVALMPRLLADPRAHAPCPQTGRDRCHRDAVHVAAQPRDGRRIWDASRNSGRARRVALCRAALAAGLGTWL